ncbi:hypothetical protein [Pseudidiomarina terrestris]|uniref:Uncharacterized protein n=1 Tax=Pseudidiomarina terrestris TaxID=2820060 RepID=A0AAW7QZ60_9GAMM|nr:MULTISPECIES: hypothetical protein [unclassified Pseudidiomarina]MDN7125510.1 hypothetical protein [Pseudidiomarina sp. 1APP75-32.1]MDN7126096.1 hypothetical protein [Pseudidiomarina sp. 1APR75-33.1]MDN7130268.1 hypothetical protein [Pseudidiomarina sp. 1APR75-15]MDN7134124.1 hypothetical protein [Pseudidiomarina sp. 1ASP75-5]MEA3588487.1 hypothetical protein [Pseudidiomarina sp. 1APP75-27a]
MTKHFQTTVLITAALYTVFFFMPYIWQHIYAEEVVYILSASGTGGMLEPTNPFPYIYSVLYVVSLLGLYTFKKFAKWLFSILIAFNLLVSPYVLGVSVSIYLDMSIGYLLTLFEGALILMLFSDEISGKLK